MDGQGPLSTFSTLSIGRNDAHGAAQPHLHPCLQVPEILYMIFESLKELKPTPLPHTSTLAVLARTCRLFSEPALDVLWSHLPSIGPLLRLFPEDKWANSYDASKEMYTVHLFRKPDDDDWPKFLRYAARLRILGHETYRFDTPLVLADPLAFVLLEQRKPTEWLFPNLRSFEWRYVPRLGTPGALSLLMLLSPRVEAIDVMQVDCEPLPERPSRALLARLRGFVRSNTNLRHVSIFCSSFIRPGASLVPDIIKGNRELRTLDIWQQTTEPLSRATWLDIACLPNLKKTVIVVDEFLGSEEEQHELSKLAEPLFPSLLQVTVRARNIASVSRFMDFVHSSHLENIALHIDEAPRDEEVRILFTKITNHRSRATLRYLYMGSTLPALPGDESYTITADTLRLLFPLRDLVTFDLKLYCNARLDDAFLLDVAAAWGKTLQSFDICTIWRHRSAAPAVTLTGLIEFVARCPGVMNLGVEFTPNVADLQEAYDAGERPCSHVDGRVARLSTGASTLRDLDGSQIVTLSGILSDLCPMLLMLDSLWEREEDFLRFEDPDDLEEREGWRKVQALTKGMGAIRWQERIWGCAEDEPGISRLPDIF